MRCDEVKAVKENLQSIDTELKQKLPDEIVEVDREVDSKFELPGVMRKLQDIKQYPAVIFN